MKSIITHILVAFFCAITIGLGTALANFNIIGTSQGLSNSTVTAITQDTSGYLWIGTFNGLNRYNGTEFTSYLKTKGNPHSLADNEIKCLYIDKTKNLWIGTANGLSLFDSEKEQFTNFRHIPSDSNSLSHNNISQIVGDSTVIWVATSDGLNKINLATHAVTRFDTTNTQLASNEIQDIAIDKQENIWVAHYDHGLDYFNTKTFSCIHFHIRGKEGFKIPSDNPESILYTDSALWVGFESGDIVSIKATEKESFLIKKISYNLPNANIISINKGKNKIIVSTDQYGIILFYPTTTEYINIGNGYEIANNKIWYCYEDANGTLWAGHYRGGISQLDWQYSERIQSFQIESDNPHSKIISAIAELKNNEIYLGTDGAGLFQLMENNTFKRFHLPYDLDKGAILSICSHENDMLLGTYTHGLVQIADSNISVITAPMIATEHSGPSGNDIRDILCFQSKVWLADHANMLNCYDPETKTFNYFDLTYAHPENGNVFPSPWCLEAMNDSSIAIGTNRGLLIFNSNAKSFEQYFEEKTESFTISSNTIHHIKKINDSTLLLGTDNGLDIFNSITHKIQQVPSALLPNANICAIETDGQNNIWISTKGGLAKLPPDLSSSLIFDESDGIPSLEFIDNSIEKTHNGYLLFGNSKGLVAVHPDSMSINQSTPKPIFTDLFLNYEKTEVTENGPLNKPLSRTSGIAIDYSVKTIGIGFSSLSFIQNHKNTFSYFLEGFDTRWSPYSKSRRINYTNLNPGHYTLKLKTKNNDGVESRPISLQIRIIPPFYKTTWFIIFAIAAGILLLIVVFKIRTKQIEQKNTFLKNHNLRLSQEIAERIAIEKQLIRAKNEAESANRAKSEFLANMSHEIRTPLNAVHGFCEILANTEVNANQKQYIESIKISSNNLLVLINDLLDLSKIEAGQLELSKKPENILTLLEELSRMFTFMAEQKGIAFNKEIVPSAPEFIETDISRLRQILVNLLGNAIKFTHEGSVTLQYWATEQKTPDCTIHIAVLDTGIGIKEKDLPKIFDSFSQIESDNSRSYEGTGLGLAICKKMSELLGGTISVTSTVGQGSSFVLTLERIKTAPKYKTNHTPLIEQEATEQSRAFILSPEHDYLEKLTEILISLSFNISVFSIDDLPYVKSQMKEADWIVVFNPEDKLISGVANCIPILTEQKSQSTFGIIPPLTLEKFELLIYKSKQEQNDNEITMPLGSEDQHFLKAWLLKTKPHHDVLDVEQMNILVDELVLRGTNSKNEQLSTIAENLKQSINIFDLQSIGQQMKDIEKLCN